MLMSKYLVSSLCSYTQQKNGGFKLILQREILNIRSLSELGGFKLILQHEIINIRSLSELGTKCSTSQCHISNYPTCVLPVKPSCFRLWRLMQQGSTRKDICIRKFMNRLQVFQTFIHPVLILSIAFFTSFSAPASSYSTNPFHCSDTTRVCESFITAKGY